ncbi:nucleoside deaminase [Acidovorax sp. SUPP2825]|uniref:nucleoside deaminase n=1 Tax=Acidovorax sp. SUPP2825 TaxID=2920879 RepID=UPI0023DE43B1|nr:nucleoside deaminase [Acidovorax sp. SUPP2825]GKS94644.1 nucleoside deaminase [Acidovorax sp. SUPP2825]
MNMPASPACELPEEVPLAPRDGLYLRRAIALADQARARGNRPFGAVIVGADDRILAEAWNANGETGDCTAHAETSAVRLASPHHPREAFVQATLYSSGEPCVMCAGAIFWANIGRVVYGIDAVRLRAFRGERLDQRDAELSCRDVFAASSHAIECIGPALIEESSASHRGAWKA